MVQLDRAQVRDQEKKCAQICKDIRNGQEQNAANNDNIEASLNRDSNPTNAAHRRRDKDLVKTHGPRIKVVPKFKKKLWAFK
jgi:hypothetical protein